MAKKNVVVLLLAFVSFFASAQTTDELQRYAGTGLDPAGKVTKIKNDGVAFFWTVPMQANEVRTTNWINTDGFTTVYRIAKSNVKSATGGIVATWANDTTQVINDLTLVTQYDSTGLISSASFSVKAKYLRYTYSNSTTAQSSFFFQVQLLKGQVTTASGNASNTIAGTTLVDYDAALLYGQNSTTKAFEPLTHNAGALNVAITNPMTGFSTAANQATQITRLDSALAKLDYILSKLNGTIATNGAITNTTFGATQTGTWTVQPGNTANTTPWLVTTSPSTTSGYSSYFNSIGLSGTNATSVKSSAGIINFITVSNAGIGAVYFKLFNKASAPMMGTDSPVFQFLIPAGATITIPANQMRLTNGIAFAVTAGIALLDATAITASTVSININYL